MQLHPVSYVRASPAGRHSTFEEGPKISPLRRISTVKEVAKVCLFLAADATAITAETILIDCGKTQLG